ncbi:hypothetical protein NQ318_000070 [Aromia moschata]|uniref:Uncharacterized protein n=1 Tax=Aromia moschata TaxID=1265417 RepID=A0AAV8YBS6_9CUCU|nr:hypothetical protein NQ318_000070 [Aromia moschata]
MKLRQSAWCKGSSYGKFACLWITEVIHVLVRCAQLKELLLLPKVCVKTQELQFVTDHNNLLVEGPSGLTDDVTQ